MPTTKTVQTDSSTFTVRELSVNELRTWWNSITTPGHHCDVVTEFSIPGISLDDLALLCDCEASAFDHLTSRELGFLDQAAKELNPAFFRLREALNESCIKILGIISDTFGGVARGDLQ